MFEVNRAVTTERERGAELARVADALLAEARLDSLDPAHAVHLATANALLAMYWELRHQHRGEPSRGGSQPIGDPIVPRANGQHWATEPVPLRPRTVKRPLNAMHADPAHPFTTAELAAIAGVSIRLLQDSFHRYVGMPPLTYLRRLRLDRVHAELSTADPQHVSVSEVATRWGFTHLGRFAAAYRQRFGVLPSHTLKQRT